MLRVRPDPRDPDPRDPNPRDPRTSFERLADNPSLGRPGRVLDTRELMVTGTPYLVPYTVSDNEIVILRVLHGAQQWPQR
ncbi:MAG: type II toxin-antitoxin system RelE/ParE family toxin [Thiohalocapsa sp.]